MRLWSKGLGKSNVGMDFTSVQVLSLREALDKMPKQAADLFSKEVQSDKIIALSGKMLPPTGWEFVILFDRKDVLALAAKLLFNRRVIGLLFGDHDVNRRIGLREEEPPEKSSVEVQP